MKPLKECKGLGVAKGHGCGKMVTSGFRKYGLCTAKCYSKWLLNTPEGRSKISKQTLKVTKPREDMQNALEEYKEDVKISNLLINVRYVCHNYIKSRDKGKPCVSCGQPWNPSHQAGHWKKAELFSTLKFWEFNIHSQCKKCNLFNDGNVQEYSIRITLRITDEQKEEIEQMARDEKKNAFKWDRIKLNEIRNYYKRKLKELKINQ